MPGRAIATARELAMAMTPAQRQRYGTLVHAITEQTSAHAASGVPAQAAARVIPRAVTSRRPRTRYTVGREAALLPLLRRLPDRTLDRALAAALRPHFRSGAASSAELSHRLRGCDAGA